VLTPTDVHYLVGLLTLISHDGDVEVELGTMVLDEAAEKERDVDVTAKLRKEDGSISAFKGIEVKDHTRPLDVTHVEQLCIKFNDMPDITYRSIVSASGYTEPAIKKARRYNVELFDLATWENPMEGFEHVKFPQEFRFIERGYKWIGNPNVTFNPHMKAPTETLEILNRNPAIVDANGNPIPGYSNLQVRANNLARHVVHDIEQQGGKIKVDVGEIKPVTFDVKLSPAACIVVGEQKLVLDRALISGSLTCSEKIAKPDFKILLKHGEAEPYVGCAVFEMSQGNLAGITVDRRSRNIRFVNVPVSDRLKKKIYRQRLK
jgi:hypothetical protein